MPRFNDQPETTRKMKFAFPKLKVVLCVLSGSHFSCLHARLGVHLTRSIINLVTIKHIKQRQSLNEDVFEASVLRFFIVSFKRCYDEYLLWFFFTICWSWNLLMSFSPPKSLSKSLSVWTSIEWRRLSSYHWHFLSVPFSKDGGLGRFKVSLVFMLQFKSFQMWRTMSLFMLLRFWLWVWKVIPYRKGMSWGMCSL